MAVPNAPPFVFGFPPAQTPVQSAQVRNNFEALARTFYTTDPALPPSPKEGQPRLYSDLATGILYYQFFIGGTWRTALQNVQFGFAAPTKQLVEFVSPLATWQVDHNLGSKPLVGVFDTAQQQITPVPLTGVKSDVRFLGRLPTAALAAGNVRTGIPLAFNGSILRFYAVCETPVSGPVDFTLNFTLTPPVGPVVPMTPQGDITVNAALVRGQEVGGAAVTSLAPFILGTTLAIDALVTTPPVDGAIEVYAELQRELGPGECRLTHVTDNRFIVEFATPQTGFVVLMG